MNLKPHRDYKYSFLDHFDLDVIPADIEAKLGHEDYKEDYYKKKTSTMVVMEDEPDSETASFLAMFIDKGAAPMTSSKPSHVQQTKALAPHRPERSVGQPKLQKVWRNTCAHVATEVIAPEGQIGFRSCIHEKEIIDDKELKDDLEETWRRTALKVGKP